MHAKVVCTTAVQDAWQLPAQAPDRGLPAPDAVIYLHLTPEAAALRGGYGAERYEKVRVSFTLLHTPYNPPHATWDVPKP
jgi:hypothetical protein